MIKLLQNLVTSVMTKNTEIIHFSFHRFNTIKMLMGVLRKVKKAMLTTIQIKIIANNN